VLKVLEDKIKLGKILSATVALAVVLFIIFDFSGIKNQLNDWKLLPEPEKLTELYFTNSNSLPSSYSPGQLQTVRFTTHNLEYQTYTYRYSIVEQYSNGNNVQTLQTGEFTLKQNQYKSVVANVKLVDAGNNARVTIELPSVNESIDYLISRSGS
jgi:hypothetical protein